MNLLTNEQEKAYSLITSAKSDVRFDSLNIQGVQYATCLMGGFFVPICTHTYLYGGACGDSVSCADTLESVCQPCTLRHPMFDSFGGGLTQNLSKETTMKALSFNGVTLTPVYRNNQIYLTSAELAKALGYASLKSVNNLYNANADEFSADMTTVIDSMTVRKTGTVNLSVRIFSLRGCHLVGMFARTPVAKDFRKWVLDILDKEVGEPVITPTPKPQSPKLSQSDYNVLRRVVRLISDSMHYQGGATTAIYARLRTLCEVDSISDIRYQHLNIIRNELCRIERCLRTYTRHRREVEINLIRGICLGNDDSVWEAIKAIEKDSSVYIHQLNDSIDTFITLKEFKKIGSMS